VFATLRSLGESNSVTGFMFKINFTLRTSFRSRKAGEKSLNHLTCLIYRDVSLPLHDVLRA